MSVFLNGTLPNGTGERVYNYDWPRFIPPGDVGLLQGGFALGSVLRRWLTLGFNVGAIWAIEAHDSTRPFDGDAVLLAVELFLGLRPTQWMGLQIGLQFAKELQDPSFAFELGVGMSLFPAVKVGRRIGPYVGLGVRAALPAFSGGRSAGLAFTPISTASFVASAGYAF